MDLYTIEPAMVQSFLRCQSGIGIERRESSYQRLEVAPVFLIATDGLVPLPKAQKACADYPLQIRL
jgi:hypothetical protein